MTSRFHFISSLSRSKKWTLGVVTVFQFWLVCSARPSQDDYGYLAELVDKNIRDVSLNFWHLWGGNLITVVITSIFLKLALLTHVWIAYTIFGLVSTVLIALSLNAGLSLFCPGMPGNERKFISLVVAMAGISNIAFPAHLASIAFTTAAIAHLWPICLFLILIHTLTGRRLPWIFLIVSGLMLTNPNIAEGSAIFGFTALFVVGEQTNLFKRIKTKLPVTQNLTPLLIGQFIGLCLIIIAPGFSSRVAIVGQGNPQSHNKLHSFRSAAIDFVASIIATPAFLSAVVIFAIMVFRQQKNFRLLYNILKDAVVPLLFFTSLFLMLIIGSTFAYAAWHQSLGLVFLSTLLSVILIYEVHLQFNLGRALTVSLLLFIALVFVFDVVSGIGRGVSWDRAYLHNICAIQAENTQDLIGAELRNPISKLGFEDIETWDWIRSDYIRWLKSTPEKTKCNF